MSMIKIIDLDLNDKKVLIRADLNAPIIDGKIISDARIRASLPTIKFALDKGAKVMVMSHLGRPIEGEYDHKFSLIPIVKYLANKLNYPVRLVKNYLNGVKVKTNELIVFENVRFNRGEIKNDETLSRQYAALCDIYVMDAFGTAHRTHASTYGVVKFASLACAGLLFSFELESLSKVLNNPARPMVIIIGGSKVSSKLNILNSLVEIADQIIVGGGIANTFIAAANYKIGCSLYEQSFVSKAKKILSKFNIILPIDVCVTTKKSETAIGIIKSINDIKDNEQILDLGNKTVNSLVDVLKKAKTILWNGTLGVFEFANFRYSTEVIAKTIAKSKAFSIVGGGDTIAAIDMLGIIDKISYISTGGGAFLEFIQNKKLPAIVALEEWQNSNHF
ncbi:phosphoglycerate kinase [Arsenophonus symbiont of Ornithomya chloropus]|uniref:phosphoglycerate kinase n=1 Tax=Arsenophonus symbiont of Ornithomya chloropus TaxID=634121 RepID=UPI0032B1CAD1